MSSTKFVFFRADRKIKMAALALDWLRHFFDFLSETAERNSTKLDRQHGLNVLYPVCVFFGPIWTRAPRGTDRSPEYNEHFCYKLESRVKISRVKNLTTEWNQKQQHFITQASRSLLWIRFVAVAFRSEEVFLRSPPPRAMSTSSLPSFVNIH